VRRRIRNIRDGGGGIVAKMGTIMPMVRNYTRNTADMCGQIAKGLDNSDLVGNVDSVVAVSPQGAGTYSLNRYPSPYGRLCVSWHRSPIFPLKTNGCAHRRGIAGNCVPDAEGFDRGRGMALSGPEDPRSTERGIPGCGLLSYFYYRFWLLQPVVTRLLNRVLLGPVRALARPLCWTEMLLPVQLLAQRVIFFTARPIQAAATDSSRPLRVLSRHFRPSVHWVPVAFSHARTRAKPCAGQ